MANAKWMELEGIVGGVEEAEENGKKKRNSKSPAAKRQRAYREQSDAAGDIPPVPDNITPAQLRAAVKETGELLTKALTFATKKGVGRAQESKNLSLAAKTVSAIWQNLGEIPWFAAAAERVCDCKRCAELLDPKTQAPPFGNLAENAWRAVHLARVALPAKEGGHVFHGSAKDWVYTLGNCVDEAKKASDALRGDGPLRTPMQVWVGVHRAEIMKPGGFLDKLAAAAAAIGLARPELRSIQPTAPYVPAANKIPTARPLNSRELADLGA